MAQVQITDTTLRDAHQSLLATRFRIEDMLPVCEKMDQVGFWSLEVWGGATFDSCIRFLKEDPWERLRQFRKALPNTRLQMLLRGQNLLGYRHYSDDVVRAFVQKSADNGMDVFRVFDALNDLRNVRVSIEAVKAAGKHAQGTLCYTTSPVHKISMFVGMACELESMGCDSIAIKDMAGLLTPSVTAELVTALNQAVNIPLHLHSHATAGLAEMCQLKAVENGCYHIDTATSTLSGGTSHPATESMVAAFKDSEYNTGLNLELLQEIGAYFYGIRKKYHHFESEFTGLDTRVQVNQIPGGMISNLANQLRDQNALGRMNEVMAEVPRVREDLGYPPLVTPLSQIVGSQAVLNVLTEQRYKSVTNEVKSYLLGYYGKSPAAVNDAVRQQVCGDEKVIACRPADLLDDEMAQLHQEIGSLAESEEDVLSYAMFPDIGRDFLEQRASGTLEPEPLEPVESGKVVCGVPPIEFNVALHGEKYHIKVAGKGLTGEHGRAFYVLVDGVSEEIIVETLDELGVAEVSESADTNGSTRPRADAPGHVSTSMPGVVVEVLVGVGDVVKEGDSLIVVEAMKMENEIQAPIRGKVIAVHVKKGDHVNPDEMLIQID